jgi:hypothetical protein
MSDQPFVVQKVEWYQFRTPEGTPFLVMVSSLPNGFFTAVPYQVEMKHAQHGLMALAQTGEEAIAQLQTTIAGKTVEQIFAQE